MFYLSDLLLRNRIWLNILAAPVSNDWGVFYWAKEKIRNA